MTRIKTNTQSLFIMLLMCCSSFIVTGQDSPAFEWANGMGSVKSINIGGYDMAYKVAIDVQGNSYVTGMYRDSANFDPNSSNAFLRTAGVPTAFGNMGVFIAKYDKDGRYVWAEGFSSGMSDIGWSVAVDSAANVYVTGTFTGTVDFDPGPGTANLTSAGSRSVFVAKYDTDGNYVWAFKMGGATGLNESGQGIDVDAAGCVYVTGVFGGEMDCNPDPNVTNIIRSPSATSGFVAKYNTDGEYIWASAMVVASLPAFGSPDSRPYDIKVDKKTDKVYVTGTFSSAYVYFSPDSSNYVVDERSGHGQSAFLAQYDTSGVNHWVFSFGDTTHGSWTYSHGVGVDGNGSVYITGQVFSTLVDFDPGTGVATLPGNGDIGSMYLAKYDSKGNFQNVLFPEPKSQNGTTIGYGISVNKRSVFISGGMNGTVDFNPGIDSFKLTNSNSGMFVAHYDTAGNFVWARNFGSASSNQAKAIATDFGGNNLFVCGRFGRTVDFDPAATSFNLTSIAAAASYNAFLFKWSLCKQDTTFVDMKVDCKDTIVNGIAYTESGIYIDHYPISISCDSVVMIKLELSTALSDPPVIRIDTFTLSTTQPYSSYQWLFNNIAIVDATDRYYTVTQNGDYKVAVANERGCTDTSQVYEVTNIIVNAKEAEPVDASIFIYPNPTEDLIYIKSPIPLQIYIQNLDGRVVPVEVKNNSISMSALSAGVYFLRIADVEGNLIKVEKIVKQ